MLRFVTDAPMFVVRNVMSLAQGYVEDIWDNDGERANVGAWVTSIIHVRDIDAMNVLTALREWRIEPIRPAKVAYGDPTFALAAAAIDRSGSAAPAASYAR